MNNEYALIKIELDETEFETLKLATEYATNQIGIYLNCLIRSEYGLDEKAIKETAAKKLRFEFLNEKIKEIPF